eukprot:CAMPEP_0114638450 /NCGR_PEP_ID=MMETSP0191-20121206/626_1 /TAXON_ID=126664 /ORGANISM="Sorites sp." /LENGTH=47 /DNA_ID= /DNA_START= /DNA_END= /DNA_ORIENTATION=
MDIGDAIGAMMFRSSEVVMSAKPESSFGMPIGSAVAALANLGSEAFW